jgi:ectoine hydroxylase-related dioxygenase (phytanoyl-CoA dioxygenase family)
MAKATKASLLSFSDAKLDFCLTDSQQQLLPTEKEIEFFHEHGWFITKKVIPETLIEFIFDAAEEFYQGRKDAELPIKGCSNWQKGDNTAVRNNEYISFQKKAFRELSLQPVIGAIAARLMDTDTVRYFQDQLISKEPNQSLDTHVGWHTDCSYHSNCTSRKLLTVWIPLHDVDEKHGSLVMVDRSHKWLHTENLRGFNHNNHHSIEQEFTQQGKKFHKIPFKLKKGQISFHHSSIVHGSYPNRSNMMRRAIALNLQDGDNRYQLHYNQGKRIHHFLDSLCRQQANGFPDYTDPAIFPVVWSER